MPYLYLVRHAQPDFAGHYDSVTELGLQQSAWLGEHFAARGLQFARVISGSLERQTSTLEAILRHLPEAPAAVTDPRFNEYDAASVLGAFHLGDERALRATGDRRRYFTAVRDALHAWSRQDGGRFQAANRGSNSARGSRPAWRMPATASTPTRRCWS